ncbi:hypothetical protein B0J12DRAFT_227534 [Macrophomina phaseolina]|uniref:Uncharacterized protein n=1 Tax=Macrophomina phaseolina TaxID=35725 RepID=A0ABQ8GPM5_9PEZI|nr:hypothetical protein B0J12DRAFT_227534 [Macrophomina phaseolina]
MKFSTPSLISHSIMLRALITGSEAIRCRTLQGNAKHKVKNSSSSSPLALYPSITTQEHHLKSYHRAGPPHALLFSSLRRTVHHTGYTPFARLSPKSTHQSTIHLTTPSQKPHSALAKSILRRAAPAPLPSNSQAKPTPPSTKKTK